MNILEQQQRNKRRTWLVMGTFVLFLLLLGVGFDFFVLGLRGSPPIGALVALAAGGFSSISSYFSGDKAVLRSSNAVPLETALSSATGNDEILKLRQLENVVDEMTIASGLPRPKTFLIADRDPNAFATGRDPEHASIAVTRGLLDVLNREELQGVVAHEMSHIRNYDIRLMTVMAALVGAVALLSDWAMRGMRFGGGRRNSSDNDSKGGGGGAIVLVAWLVAAALAPAVGQLLALAVSRRREYLADASGAELTRNPLALAGALQKIEQVAGPTASVKRGTAHLCIADPLGKKVDLKEGFWADLLATHPPMPKRIAALEQMAYLKN